MDILEAIMTRRSIRKFTGEKLTDAQLEVLLKSAFQAPSAHNRQPWHFVVIRDKELLENAAAVHPYAKMLPQAGCGIVVVGDSEQESETGFLIENCSAAIQNILLAAHGLGLGAVWCGLYPIANLTRKFSQLLELPSNMIPVGVVAIGHKNEERSHTDRFDSQKVHYEKW